MDNHAIQRINIHNYRGLSNLHIDDLSNINVFVGSNNCGKTSILEAIKIMSAPKDIGQLIVTARYRAQPTSIQANNDLCNYLLSIFHKTKEDESQNYFSIRMDLTVDGHMHSYDADATSGSTTDYAGNVKQTLDIAIGTAVDNGKTSYIRETIVNGSDYHFEETESPLFRSIYMHSCVNVYKACVHYLSEYIIREGKDEIIKLLNSFDPKIQDISIVGDNIYLFSSTSGSMPLYSYGAGLQKAVLLTSVLVSCKDGILLIDEIDNTIHISAFENVFTWFIGACLKNNVQAFVTTHSMEALDTILAVTNNHFKHDDVLRILTLRKDASNHITRCKIRNGVDALSDRELFRMELRV